MILYWVLDAIRNLKWKKVRELMIVMQLTTEDNQFSRMIYRDLFLTYLLSSQQYQNNNKQKLSFLKSEFPSQTY